MMLFLGLELGLLVLHGVLSASQSRYPTNAALPLRPDSHPLPPEYSIPFTPINNPPFPLWTQCLTTPSPTPQQWPPQPSKPGFIPCSAWDCEWGDSGAFRILWEFTNGATARGKRSRWWCWPRAWGSCSLIFLLFLLFFFRCLSLFLPLPHLLFLQTAFTFSQDSVGYHRDSA